MSILTSTFFLTLLLMVGLFFFIRASVKDRTQQVKLMAQLPKISLLEQLQTYFTQRAYDLTAVDPQQETMTFEGFVRPSWFLAIFLSILAAVGLLCLGFVLCFIYPPLTPLFLGIGLLSPLAGVFYWKKAGRLEKVRLTLENTTESALGECSVVTVIAHRDELIQLQQTLALKPIS
ncbi:cofactor assembly of complex C subunit B [Crocosphaera sp. XPORK-15E]|uniref:cofactor assembly of complex C subunit B n=1 Tax=Crocosphaera sp. XPORK-15E TaxID=3110247 RepID=UPI002B20EBAD|nr:cofactor assembly of complex C subunit B [Crocosphaera sp. XPORK-15E]MEA5532804.1 cofactor assembly of complex C subunit B [Crocosphaera sp. XPORK-15E]